MTTRERSKEKPSLKGFTRACGKLAGLKPADSEKWLKERPFVAIDKRAVLALLTFKTGRNPGKTWMKQVKQVKQVNLGADWRKLPTAEDVFARLTLKAARVPGKTWMK